MRTSSFWSTTRNDRPNGQWDRQKNTDADRFLAALDIREWDTDKFVELLAEKASEFSEPDAKFMGWLGGKPVEWHQELYALLSSENLWGVPWQRGSLKSLRIVRLADGRFGRRWQLFLPQRKYSAR